MTDSPFMTMTEAKPGDTMATAPMGERVESVQRYKLPLLPGEEGPKKIPAGQEPWVPGGVQSATNLAGQISESRALGIWERERTQLGLALRPDLVERLTLLVNTAVYRDGLDLREKLRESKTGEQLVKDLAALHNEARTACYANMAGVLGTNRHDVWELRGFSGQLYGSPEANRQVMTLEALLAEKGLKRTNFRERVVRNVALGCAGRFDDILETTRDLEFAEATHPREWSPDEDPTTEQEFKVTRIPRGTLLMSDLKTKKDPYWSLLEVGIQLVIYASAEHMLDEPRPDGSVRYIDGPKNHVSQEWGVVLRMPVDGSKPHLIRIDLQQALEDAWLARAVCTARSRGRAVGTHRAAEW
jgi:hypothetical protein